MNPPSKRPVLWLAAAVALCAGAAGCGSEDNVYVHPNPLFFDGPSRAFSIGLPDGWEVREYTGQPCVYALGPADGQEGRPTLTVSALELPPGSTLHDFAASRLAQLRDLPGFDLVDQRRRSVPGLQARSVTYRQTLTNEPVIVRELLAVRGRSLYLVAAATRAERFAEMEPVFEQSLRSLRALPPDDTNTREGTP